MISEGTVGQENGPQHPAALSDELLQPLQRREFQMRQGRQDRQLVALVADLDSAVRDLGAGEDLLVEIVEVVMGRSRRSVSALKSNSVRLLSGLRCCGV